MIEVKKKRVMLSAGALMIAALFFAAGFFTGRATMDESVGRPTLDVPVYEGAGGLMVSSDEGSGVSVVSEKISPEHYDEYGVMPTAESAYTVTATVKDANGKVYPDGMQSFTFSLAWKSSTSETLTSKIQMTTTENTATLTCLTGFSTQILLTATSKINTQKSATVTIDYAKRFKGVKIHLAQAEDQFTRNTDADSVMTEVSVQEGGEYKIFLLEWDKHGMISSTPANWAWYLFKCRHDDAIYDTVGTREENPSVTITFRYNTAFFTSATTSYDSSLGKASQKDYIVSTSYMAPSQYGYVSQYELLEGMGNNMEQYVGENAWTGVYHGGSARGREFFNKLLGTAKPIECEITLKGTYSGTYTVKFYLSPMGVSTVSTVSTEHIF